MMLLPLTSSTILILVPLFIVLTFRVIGYRRSKHISIGDQGDQELLRRIRMQGNFIEYVPFTLLLILLCELQGASVNRILVGVVFLILGRYMHAYGLSSAQAPMIFRVGGMVFTILSIVSLSLALLYVQIFS